MTVLTRDKLLELLEVQYEVVLADAHRRAKRFHPSPTYLSEPEMDIEAHAEDLLRSIQNLRADDTDYKSAWEDTDA